MGEPEVIGSSIGLVPTNAPVLSDLANFRVAGQPEVEFRIAERRSRSVMAHVPASKLKD
jgi:hypothetical protein